MSESAFDVTRRGYDRDQVDDRLRAMGERLATAEEGRRHEKERASQLEAQLSTRTAASAASAASASRAPVAAVPAVVEVVHEGFGVRAEKVLRLAEQLAADLRSQSAEEAAALVERARADAERHRHEVEQSLIVRAAQQDQEAARRQVELHEREQQIAAELVAARDKAEEIRALALREADQLRGEARLQAAELRQEADASIAQQQEVAGVELRRVRTLRDDVRIEMARLHELLAAEVVRSVEPVGPPVDDGHDVVTEAEDFELEDLDDREADDEIEAEVGADGEMDGDEVEDEAEPDEDDTDEAAAVDDPATGSPRLDTEEFAAASAGDRSA